MKIRAVVPDNGPMSNKWFILHDPVGNSQSSLGWEVFVGPVHHGLAASYMTDVLKGYKGSGQFALVEVKEFITVQEN